MKIPVEKNKEYIVDIIDQGFEGEGIAKIEDYTIFIPDVIKEEKVKIRIVKVNTSYGFGKVIEIIQKSPYRTIADCNTYPRCGGCNLRHIEYDKTLDMKEEIVQNLVNKTLKTKVEIEKVIGMGNPYHYRNKAQYPVGLDKNNKPITGVYAKRSHHIIPIDRCSIQSPISEQIAKYLLEFIKENHISVYNEKTGKGIIRHIIIKVGFQIKEVMCILVLNEKQIVEKQMEEKLVKSLLSKFPTIKTVVKNFNRKNTNVILGNENVNLYGDGFIYDILGDYIFKISPMSFYQINPIQTEVLYHTAIEMAKLQKEDTNIVFDLYCGIGTISTFLSSYAKKVYGIEIVKQAIEDAKENAKLNHISNMEFIAGDVEEVLTDLIENKKIKPDVVFVDPPRKGLDSTTIQNILKIQPKKVIYISCNPATLVRDLAKLEDSYCIKQIQPVDMFPFTSHVECVTVLSLKKNGEA